MVKVGAVSLPHVIRYPELDPYVIAKTTIPGRLLPIHEPIGGGGITFDIDGEIWDSDGIIATKAALRTLQVNPATTLDLEDGSDILVCLVGDVSFDNVLATPERVPYHIKVHIVGLYSYGNIAESFGGFSESLSWVAGGIRSIAESFGGFSELLSGELTAGAAIHVGKDTIGNIEYAEVNVGQTADGTNDEILDYLEGCKYTFTRMTITKLGIYSRVSGNAKLGLFDDVGGTPTNVVIAEAAIAATGGQWNYLTLAAKYYANGDFWIFDNIATTGVSRYTGTGTMKYKALSYANAWTGGGFADVSETLATRAICYRGKGHVLGTRYQATASGNTVKIRVWFPAGSSGNVRAALYVEGTGHPTTLIVESGSQAIVADSWNELTITSTAIVNNTEYWPMIQVDDIAALPHRETGTAEASDRSFYYGLNYGAFPADLTALGTVESDTAANRWSIWA